MPESESSNGWQAGFTRFTLFFPAPASVSALELFSHTFGEQPENTAMQGRGAVSVAETNTLSVARRIELKPDRVDIIVAANASESTVAAGAFPVLGSVGAQLDQLVAIGSRAAGLIPTIDRVAIGAQCLLPSSSGGDSYEKLKSMLHIPYIDKTSIKEFMLRLNKPTKMVGDGYDLEVNCISVWSSLALVLSSTPFSPQLNITPFAYATQVEFDINTPPTLSLRNTSPNINYLSLLSSMKQYCDNTLRDGI